MANQSEDYLTDYTNSRMRGEMWTRALRDIFYFIATYVPRDLFDLDLAALQQIALLKAVMDGKRYFIIRAPRKGGKTICVAIIAVWLTLRNQKYRVFIVSGSEQQAEWLYKYCRKILWPSGPQNAWKREFFAQFLEREPMVSITEYKEGGWIMYSAASSKAVNAPTADCEIDDEYVLIPTNIVEEAWPMIRESEDPRRFILSTATPNKENTESFLDMLDAASDTESKWSKFEWMAEDCPFLKTAVADEDAEIARGILSKEMFETQYLGSLPRKAGRIFPQTFVREAFVALNPNNPGYLIDGSLYMKDGGLIFQGDAKGGIDWGFEHDTVLTEGFLGLDRRIHVMKQVAGFGSSPSDWADLAAKDSLEYGIETWYADASGAFQNKEIRNRGFRVVPRAFQHPTEGKEWMIGNLYDWFQRKAMIVPDTDEFEPLKKQLQKYRRGQDGKPKKGEDDYVDSLLCLVSGWDPRYVLTPAYQQPPPVRNILPVESANDWVRFKSGEAPWMPQNWSEKRKELTRNPWER